MRTQFQAIFLLMVVISFSTTARAQIAEGLGIAMGILTMPATSVGNVLGLVYSIQQEDKFSDQILENKNNTDSVLLNKLHELKHNFHTATVIEGTLIPLQFVLLIGSYLSWNGMNKYFHIPAERPAEKEGYRKSALIISVLNAVFSLGVYFSTIPSVVIWESAKDFLSAEEQRNFGLAETLHFSLGFVGPLMSLVLLGFAPWGTPRTDRCPV